MKVYKKTVPLKKIDGYKLHDFIEHITELLKGCLIESKDFDRIIFKLPQIKGEIQTTGNEIIDKCYHEYYDNILIIWKPRFLSSLADAEDEVNTFILKLEEQILHYQTPNKIFTNWRKNYAP